MAPRIAFYAPLKPPGHPIPSGDRETARNLVKALALNGFGIEVATEVISYQKRPGPDLFHERRGRCEAEAARLIGLWSRNPAGRPDLWFTYHPYCKSPDWIGPAVARHFAIPYVTAEACRTRQATDADWAGARAAVQAAVKGAAVNFCMKPSDRAYLESFLPDMANVVPLSPFIDLSELPGREPPVRERDGPPVILAVGMMRPGAKTRSYELLAEALQGLSGPGWRLEIVGDGPERPAVEAMFAFAAGRVGFAGAVPRADVFARMAAADIFAWPGVREAYGVVYLEAQALGLPVAAFATLGVPVVVADGEGGLLAPEDDLAAYRGVIARLLASPQERTRLGAAGRARVRERHGLEAAARTLGDALRPLLSGAGR